MLRETSAPPHDSGAFNLSLTPPRHEKTEQTPKDPLLGKPLPKSKRQVFHKKRKWVENPVFRIFNCLPSPLVSLPSLWVIILAEFFILTCSLTMGGFQALLPVLANEGAYAHLCVENETHSGIHLFGSFCLCDEKQ